MDATFYFEWIRAILQLIQQTHARATKDRTYNFITFNMEWMDVFTNTYPYKNFTKWTRTGFILRFGNYSVLLLLHPGYHHYMVSKHQHANIKQDCHFD